MLASVAVPRGRGRKGCLLSRAGHSSHNSIQRQLTNWLGEVAKAGWIVEIQAGRGVVGQHPGKDLQQWVGKKGGLTELPVAKASVKAHRHCSGRAPALCCRLFIACRTLPSLLTHPWQGLSPGTG